MCYGVHVGKYTHDHGCYGKVEGMGTNGEVMMGIISFSTEKSQVPAIRVLQELRVSCFIIFALYIYYIILYYIILYYIIYIYIRILQSGVKFVPHITTKNRLFGAEI